LTADSRVFDSFKQQITIKHVLATTAYPTYYFHWVEVNKGVYAWADSLLRTTPIREVTVPLQLIINEFSSWKLSKNIDNLPAKFIWSRTRNTWFFSDKIMHNIKM